MEVARTRSCIAVVDIGVDPADGGSSLSAQQTEIGLGSSLQLETGIVNVGVMNKHEIDRCPSKIDRREGRPAIVCKIFQERLSFAGSVT
jgi:hypothetical protein